MTDTMLQWLENSLPAIAISQSIWLYPILEIVHITGIALLVGPAIMFDLRLLGFSKNLPVSLLARHLLPWSRRALLLIVPSGLLLFITNAAALWYDPVFLIKMLLLLVAGLNAFVFHRFTFRSVTALNDAILPTGAQVTAGISIIIWLAIIACGRLLAY
ncbi:DUF6644 family protein [Segetibacter sp.]|jgi:hypothetical protein|uniref:DUF6644 family protein n=1 Tax=Segetibacter sp. TaxID=2231182 RepID=UPI0026035850|nr:DUF6644 family protein [Segetibacter sp.]MCW3080910.1 hypothetical protein [Segetibacter sp.]